MGRSILLNKKERNIATTISNGIDIYYRINKLSCVLILIEDRVAPPPVGLDL